MSESVIEKESTKEHIKYVVMKSSGDILKEFHELIDAQKFSEKANKTYKENGINCTTIVINAEILS